MQKVDFNKMNKLTALWYLIFPLCIVTVIITAIVFFREWGYGFAPYIIIGAISYALFIIFIGVEELIRPKEVRKLSVNR